MYLIINATSKEAAVVDPADAPVCVEAARKAGATIKYVLTTHHHFDHAGGNNELKKLVKRRRGRWWRRLDPRPDKASAGRHRDPTGRGCEGHVRPYAMPHAGPHIVPRDGGGWRGRGLHRRHPLCRWVR